MGSYFPYSGRLAKIRHIDQSFERSPNCELLGLRGSCLTCCILIPSAPSIFLKFPCNDIPLAETHDIDALKARDPGAMDRLVREESGLVFRCVGRLIRDEDEVRNLTQETFLQAIQNIESFRGEAKVSTWLCSIAINLARAFLRKARRYDVMPEEDLEGLLPTFGFLGQAREEYREWNPEKFTEQEERVKMVRDALDRLPEDYKTVIVLRDLEELSTQEVAELLDASEGAVRVRLHRARMALRKLLDGRMTD